MLSKGRDVYGLLLQVLIPHRTDVKIESMSASQDYLVVFQRIKGLQVSSQTLGFTLIQGLLQQSLP